MTHPTSHSAYRPDVDGLRAIAVLSVVVFHAFPSVLPGGFVGVDVFFVISGYLISSIIFKALSNGEFSFADFYARRVRRIFPALLVVTAGSLALGWSVLLPDEYARLAKHALAGLGFVANVVFWDEAGYFDTDAAFKPLLHLWSLGIEEQFYIIWPALAVLCWRLRLSLWHLIVGLGAASFVVSVVMSSSAPSASYFLPPARVWELLLGAALAFVVWRCGRLPGATSPLHANLLGAVGCGLIVLALALIDERTAFPGAWALLPGVGAVLTIAAGPTAALNQRFLGHPLMVGVGLISFPLYLWHWPLLSFVRIVSNGNPAPGALWWAVGAAVVLAWLTYRLCETPLRLRGGNRTAAGLVCASLAAAGVATNIVMREGLAFRLKDAQARVEAEALEWDESRRADEACRRILSNDVPGGCLIADLASQPTIAIIGDSHANHFYWGLSERLAAHRQNLIQLGRGGCLPLQGLDIRKDGRSSDCPETVDAAIAHIANSPAIHTVFIAGRWMSYMTGEELKDAGRAIEQDEELVLDGATAIEAEDRERLITRSLDRTLQTFVEAGKRVVFMHAIPELAFHARECVTWSPNPFVRRIPRPSCEVARDLIDTRNKQFRPALEAVLARHPKVAVVDPLPLMCDERTCFGKRDGRLLYRDDDHLSVHGSHWIGQAIAPQLPFLLAGAPIAGGVWSDLR